MKSAFLSGLASTSLLLVSCAAGDDEADGAEIQVTAPIDPAAAETGSLADMQGQWVSDNNSADTILLEGSSFRTLRNGEQQDEVSIIFVDSCKTRVPDIDGKAFVLRGKEKQTCYLLYSVSEEKLSYIDGTRGRTSRFTRKE